jgi:RNA polymerase sigma factor (sigma-70 family)
VTDTPGPPRSSFFRFPSTPWTLIRQALGGAASQRKRDLLGQLVLCYWKPLYAYYRAKGKSRAAAEDLVQGLLARLMSSADVLPEPDKTPRFRAWLLTCARHHLIDALRGERPDVRQLVSLDDLRAEHGDAFEPAGEPSPEQEYRAAWRRQVLARALAAVATFSEARQRNQDFQIFLEYYASPVPQKVTWEQIARRHGLPTWKQASRKADWVKEHFGRAIRREIRAYVETDEEVDDELRDLLG